MTCFFLIIAFLNFYNSLDSDSFKKYEKMIFAANFTFAFYNRNKIYFKNKNYNIDIKKINNVIDIKKINNVIHTNNVIDTNNVIHTNNIFNSVFLNINLLNIHSFKNLKFRIIYSIFKSTFFAFLIEFLTFFFEDKIFVVNFRRKILHFLIFQIFKKNCNIDNNDDNNDINVDNTSNNINNTSNNIDNTSNNINIDNTNSYHDFLIISDFILFFLFKFNSIIKIFPKIHILIKKFKSEKDFGFLIYSHIFLLTGVLFPAYFLEGELYVKSIIPICIIDSFSSIFNNNILKNLIFTDNVVKNLIFNDNAVIKHKNCDYKSFFLKNLINNTISNTINNTTNNTTNNTFNNTISNKKLIKKSILGLFSGILSGFITEFILFKKVDFKYHILGGLVEYFSTINDNITLPIFSIIYIKIFNNKFF